MGLTHADQLTEWRGHLDEMGDTTATFEWAFRWLGAHRPPPSPPRMVHGDFRMGNLIVDETGLAAVLDWELVHIGEVSEDLAWFCIRAWRFGAPERLGAGGLGSIQTFLSAYEVASGTTVDREAFRWWLTLATLRWGVICRFQAERHLSGQTPSVELAAIGRRVSETEWDVLDLLDGGPGRWICTGGRRPRNSSPRWPTSSTTTSRGATDGHVNFHARVAANVLRIVERELLDESTADVTDALAALGFADEMQLAAAIRAGEMDLRARRGAALPAHDGPPPAWRRPSRIRLLAIRRVATLTRRIAPKSLRSGGLAPATRARRHACPTGRPSASACASPTTPR